MSKRSKLIVRILSGTSDANINFNELCQLLGNLNFEERIRGSHHIFTKVGMEEIINIQPKGANSKPYQVKQIRNLILKYRLGEENDQI